MSEKKVRYKIVFCHCSHREIGRGGEIEGKREGDRKPKSKAATVFALFACACAWFLRGSPAFLHCFRVCLIDVRMF